MSSSWEDLDSITRQSIISKINTCLLQALEELHRYPPTELKSAQKSRLRETMYIPMHRVDVRLMGIPPSTMFDICTEAVDGYLVEPPVPAEKCIHRWCFSLNAYELLGSTINDIYLIWISDKAVVLWDELSDNFYSLSRDSPALINPFNNNREVWPVREGYIPPFFSRIA